MPSHHREDGNESAEEDREDGWKPVSGAGLGDDGSVEGDSQARGPADAPADDPSRRGDRLQGEERGRQGGQKDDASTTMMDGSPGEKSRGGGGGGGGGGSAAGDEETDAARSSNGTSSLGILRTPSLQDPSGPSSILRPGLQSGTATPQSNARNRSRRSKSPPRNSKSPKGRSPDMHQGGSSPESNGGGGGGRGGGGRRSPLSIGSDYDELGSPSDLASETSLRHRTVVDDEAGEGAASVVGSEVSSLLERAGVANDAANGRAGAEARRLRRAMELLRDSQLFGPSLFGPRFVGRARVPLSMLLEGRRGDGEFKVEGSNGMSALGLSGRRTTLLLRWERTEPTATDFGSITITVVVAKHLPKVDRLGLCDCQAIVELFDEVKHTKVVLDTLDPEFGTRLTFPIPAYAANMSYPPASPSSRRSHGVDTEPWKGGAIVTIVHRDQEEQLQVLASQCTVEVVEKGTLLQCVGDSPEKLTILSEGTVGLFESLQRPGNHGARARARREAEPSPGGMPPPPRTQDLVEVGRVSKRGACFGEECLLLGETPRVTACTLSRCAIMRVSEAALGKSLRASPKLAERLALAVTTAERERAEAESQDMSVHVTVVRAKALPEEYNLEWGQSDPTVFLELEGQRARTLSQRNTRKHGQEPIFEESFVFDGVKHKSSFLRMSLCDVDRSGMYERVIGRCEIKVASLLERRQLKEDMTLSMPNKSDMHHFRDADDGNSSQGPELCLEASQRLFALKHVPRRKLHQSMILALGMPDWEREEEERLGSVFHKDAIPLRGKANAPVGWIPYEDSESSSDEEGVKQPRKKIVDPNAAAEDQEKKARSSTETSEAGVLEIEVRIFGRYYQGESEFLQTLRMMGFESHAHMLTRAGFRTVDDLCREIDEGKLALLCPSMKRHRRRLFLERLRKGRLGSFMGAEASRIASHVRSKYGVTPLVSPPAYATAEAQWERRLVDRYFFNLEGKDKSK